VRVHVRDNSQELSHGCESVVEAMRVLYTLAASLGSPTISMGILTAFISTLLASTDTFLAYTTLTRPTLILMGPCKHSHSSATVSRPPVALSQYKHSHCVYKHSYNLYMHSHGL
ncbi:MAG: hypothetical protein ACK53Y_08945, partial [bacterium]